MKTHGILLSLLLTMVLVGAGCTQQATSDTSYNGSEDMMDASGEEMMEEKNEGEDMMDEDMAAETAVLADGEYAADVEESRVRWEAAKVVGNGHYGAVAISEFNLTVEDGVPTAARVVMDMTAMTVEDLEGNGAQTLLTHLKSDDFFNVETYPEASFVLTNATQNADGTMTLEGTMEMIGTEAPVSFDVSFMEQDGATHAVGTLVVDRTEFGLTFGSGSFFDDLGDSAIKDEFELEFDVVLIGA